MTIEQINGDTSPFPSSSEMDFDLWRVAPAIHPANHHRTIFGVADSEVVHILGAAHRDSDRDATARRVEMIGDLYEELRKLVDRAKVAGLDVAQAEATLNEFVAPKPFPEVV